MSARSKNPFEANRIQSRPVRGVGALKDNERGHSVHREFEASIKKSRPMRSGQYPSVANPRVPDARIVGAAGNRVPTARPHLEFMATLLGAILGSRKRGSQKCCQKECQKETARFPKESCHKFGQG